VPQLGGYLYRGWFAIAQVTAAARSISAHSMTPPLRADVFWYHNTVPPPNLMTTSKNVTSGTNMPKVGWCEQAVAIEFAVQPSQRNNLASEARSTVALVSPPWPHLDGSFARLLQEAAHPNIGAGLQVHALAGFSGDVDGGGEKEEEEEGGGKHAGEDGGRRSFLSNIKNKQQQQTETVHILSQMVSLSRRRPGAAFAALHRII